MLALALAAISAVIWLYLLAGRGLFWLGRERDTGLVVPVSEWPTVAVVIPARNEAALIGESVGSVLRQDYAGPLRLFVVDDNSDDGTAAAARSAAERSSRDLTIIDGQAQGKLQPDSTLGLHLIVHSGALGMAVGQTIVARSDHAESLNDAAPLVECR